MTTTSPQHPGRHVHLDQRRGRHCCARVAVQHARRSAFVTPSRHLDTCPIRKQLEHQRTVDLAGTVTLHLHLRCFGVWQAEVEKLGMIIDVTESRASYRPIGTVSLATAVDMVSEAIVYARGNASRLMVNVSALRGFAPPTIDERYGLAERWAAAANGRLRLAVVATAKMIHPQKVGITFAATHGLVSGVFVSEAEAIAWLDS